MGIDNPKGALFTVALRHPLSSRYIKTGERLALRRKWYDGPEKGSSNALAAGKERSYTEFFSGFCDHPSFLDPILEGRRLHCISHSGSVSANFEIDGSPRNDETSSRTIRLIATIFLAFPQDVEHRFPWPVGDVCVSVSVNCVVDKVPPSPSTAAIASSVGMAVWNQEQTQLSRTNNVFQAFS